VGEGCRTIYIVDDDSAVCHALTLLFENVDYTVMPFASAESLLASVSEASTGVLILDLNMADMSGLELQAELRKRGIGLKTIFISGYGNVEKSVLAIKGGALDFIEKPFTNKQLLNSVGNAMLLASAEQEECRRRQTLENKYERLTPREREVMTYLVSGVSNKNLAEQLGLSSRTVEIHRSKIMRKMGVTSLPDLVRMVYASNHYQPEEVLIDISQSLHLQEDQSD
jgi:FixJ family two-component response regulator